MCEFCDNLTTKEDIKNQSPLIIKENIHYCPWCGKEITVEDKE